MKQLNYHSCLIDNETIWTVTSDQYFMKINLISKESSFINYEGESICSEVTYPFIKHNDQIYFCDQHGSYLYIYSTSGKSLRKLVMPSSVFRNWSCFTSIIETDGRILFFPKWSDNMIVFDIDKETFREKKLCMTILDGSCISQTILAEGNAYMFMLNSNRCFVYQTQNDSVSIITIPFVLTDLNYKISFRSGNWYILFSDHLEVYDISFSHKRSIDIPEKQRGYYNLAVGCNSKVWFMPFCNKNLLCYDENLKEFSEQTSPDDQIFINDTQSPYPMFFENDRFIIFPNRVSNYQVIIDVGTGEVKWIKIKTPSLEEEVKYSLQYNKNLFYEANTAIDIIRYLPVKKPPKQTKDIGRIIHEMVKGDVLR